MFGWLFSYLLVLVFSGIGGLVMFAVSRSPGVLPSWGLLVFGIAAFLAVATSCLLVAVLVAMQLIKMKDEVY